MTTLGDFVRAFSDRGECMCGVCIDRGDKPDPTGHVADLVLFKVAAQGEPDAQEFVRLTSEHQGEFCEVNPFDGKEHGYIELGGWIGDQGLALQYMGLGVLLGVFKLLTPDTVLPGVLDDEMRMQLARSGYVTVTAATIHNTR